MKMPGKIDLHMHTTVSDGTDTPAEILANVRNAGIRLFSVTDHDALKGSAAILNMRAADDPAFVTGVEFSCRDEDGKYHILGYGYDPEAESIRSVVDLGHSYRINKVRRRLDFLRTEFGFRFPAEEITKLFALDNPGKPHIGNMMVKLGFAESKEQAIKNFINKIHFQSEYVRPQEAISGILKAGGIPVLAHPFYGSGDQLILGDEMDKRLRRLMEFGLQGVEAYYSGFTPKLIRSMVAFADKYGLYVTAGSDYHGTNKMIQLGENWLEEDTELPEGLKRFLRDAHISG